MATSLNEIYPGAPIIELDRRRTMVLNWLGWSRLEGIYGDFMRAWTVLFRLTNSSSAVEFLHQSTGVDPESFLAASQFIEKQGPVMNDLATVIWAACIEEAEDRGETITIRQIERYMKPGKLNEYLALVAKVIENMVPPQNPPVPAPNE